MIVFDEVAHFTKKQWNFLKNWTPMPTKDEKRWLDDITQIGCIVCILTGRGATPAEVHHMLSGGRRMGHLLTIPLCFQHHRSGRNDVHIVSRDHSQRRFEARYGTEQYLLEQTRIRVEQRRA